MNGMDGFAWPRRARSPSSACDRPSCLRLSGGRDVAIAIAHYLRGGGIDTKLPVGENGRLFRGLWPRRPRQRSLPQGFRKSLRRSSTCARGRRQRDDGFGKLCVCAVRPRIRSMRGPRCQAAADREDSSHGCLRGNRWQISRKLSDVDKGKTRIPRRDKTHAYGASGVVCWGVAKLVKAPDFDSGIRGFESFLPSHSTAVTRSGIATIADRDPRLIFRSAPDRSRRRGRVPGTVQP